MISWALKRNSDSARDAPVSGTRTAGKGRIHFGLPETHIPHAPLTDDTTQIDLPDTPAPVFAVRALKTAIFGTPAPRDRRAASKTAKDKLTTAPSTENSPAKPPGILLTPGTGTSRRKRVSFGHDVKQGSAGTARTSTTGLPDECPGKFPSPWVERLEDELEPRPKTRLQQAMESSRKGHTAEGGADGKEVAPPAREPEDMWEEVDDESDFEADITMDLNEPHSRSGKYWKSYFETYHTDAKAEMEKLVKYKHLAKSYAKMKDTEAVQLNQRLQEEQDKVKALEEKVADMARQGALGTRRRSGGESDLVLAEELKKQTALAAEYRLQVEELEALLQDNINDLGDGRQQRRNTSPRTQRTLMETQRELRRARSQARELEKLQEERDRLRSDLKFAEQRAGKLAEENRKLSGEVSQSTSRIQDLEKRLEDSKGLYEKLKDDAKSRYVEAQQVLKKRNEKISELQEEVESLKKGGAETKRATRSTRAKSFDEKSTSLKSLETTEEGSARLLKGLEALKKRTTLRGTTTTTTAAPTEPRQRDKRGAEPAPKRTPHDDATLAQARALREKLEAEFGTKGLPAAASSVFSDRGNLQDSQSSASSGRSAHSRGSQQDLHANVESDEPKPRRAAARSTWAPTTAEKATLEDLLADKRGSRASLELGQTRKATAAAPPRPPSRESDTAPDVGNAAAANAQSSSAAAWNTANTAGTARTTGIPEHRRTAALARIQRRIAERKLLQQLGRDKENARP